MNDPASREFATEQILGIRFFNSTVEDAVDAMCARGGLLVVPAGPALVGMQYDEGYRDALLRSDVAIADSGAMVLLWKFLRSRSVSRISGLRYLMRLLETPQVRAAHATFFILPTERAQEKARTWFSHRGQEFDDEDCYIAPRYQMSPVREFSDAALLERLHRQRPPHIVIGLGGGVQEKLGLYLKENCTYRPAIHCIGAALGFLTGDQKPIPVWADRLYLGWLLRLARNPRLYGRRFWAAHELPGLIAKYGSSLPPLRGVALS